MNITVRDIDEIVFRDFKAEVVRDGTTLGNAFTMAMKLWLEHYKKDEKKRKSLMDLTSFDWGKGTGNSSLEVDDILYGG